MLHGDHDCDHSNAKALVQPSAAAIVHGIDCLAELNVPKNLSVHAPVGQHQCAMGEMQ